MSDASSFFLMLFLLVFSVGATWMFSDQRVIPADIEWANNSCDANGGLDILFADVDALEVRCKNGAVFTAGKKLKRSQP